MTKDKLWAAYVAKNPRFKTSGANLTAAGLKKLFDQTWDYAHDAGFVAGKQAVRDAASTQMPDFMRGIFKQK